MHKLIAVGRIGREPDTRITQNQKEVASFSLATDVGYGENKRTEWFRCVVFGKRASVISKYCSKGDQIYVEGTIKLNTFTGKDGETKASNELWVDDFTFIGSNDNKQPDKATKVLDKNKNISPVVDAPMFTNDDIPF